MIDLNTYTWKMAVSDMKCFPQHRYMLVGH